MNISHIYKDIIESKIRHIIFDLSVEVLGSRSPFMHILVCNVHKCKCIAQAQVCPNIRGSFLASESQAAAFHVRREDGNLDLPVWTNRNAAIFTGKETVRMPMVVVQRNYSNSENAHTFMYGKTRLFSSPGVLGDGFSKSGFRLFVCTEGRRVPRKRFVDVTCTLIISKNKQRIKIGTIQRVFVCRDWKTECHKGVRVNRTKIPTAFKRIRIKRVEWFKKWN